MYGIGVVIGIYVANPDYSDLGCMLFGFVTALFLQASAFTLNDYIDYEVDAANRRLDRPLVRGELSRNFALLLCLASLPLGLIAAYLISPLAFFFAILITLAGYAYNIKLKEFGIVGNLYIALSMAAPFLFGSIVASNTVTESVVMLSLIAFLSGLGREVMKGIEDVEGDALRDVRSIARVRGEKFAAKLASALYITAVALSPLPFIYLPGYAGDVKYAIPVAVTDIILLYVAAKLLREHGKNKIGLYRKQTLIAMLFGLAGFLAGAR